MLFRNKLVVKIYYIIIAIIFLLLPFQSVAEAGYVIAQLEIDPPPGMPFGGAPMAEVGDGSTGTVQFKGHITLREYPIKRDILLFDFEASTDRNNDRWGASVFPINGVLMPWETELDIDIYVTAPLYESVDAYRHVRVGGSVISNPSGIPGNFTPNYVDVHVAPYIKFVTTSIEGFRRVWPGEIATFEIGIMNFGNRVESFHVEVTNIDFLNAAGLAVVFKTETVEVAPREEEVFTFEVHGSDQEPHPWRSQMTTINLLVTPTNELPEGVSAPTDLTYYAQEWFVYYYEFGPEWPDVCYLYSIIGIVLFVVVYKYLKKRSDHKKLVRKMLRRKKREERRKKKTLE